MRGLDAPDLLELHARGRGLPPARRALLLLEAAVPEAPADRLADLPVGRRDERILELRARTLGPAIQSETRCPRCDERLELDLDSQEFQAAAPDDPALAPPPPVTLSFSTDEGDWELVVRLPSGRDVAELAERGGTATELLERCVVDARSDGEAVASAGIPAEARQAVEEAIVAADPLADLQLALTCPECGHSWSSPFDPPAFFWGEIEERVPRILQEVHLLASSYGWSEDDILGLDAWRRGQYLQFLGA